MLNSGGVAGKTHTPKKKKGLAPYDFIYKLYFRKGKFHPLKVFVCPSPSTFKTVKYKHLE